MVETRSGTSTEGDSFVMPEPVLYNEAGEKIKIPPLEFYVQTPMASKSFARQQQAILALNKLQENCSNEQWLNELSLANIMQWREMAENSL